MFSLCPARAWIPGSDAAPSALARDAAVNGAWARRRSGTAQRSRSLQVRREVDLAAQRAARSRSRRRRPPARAGRKSHGVDRLAEVGDQQRDRSPRSGSPSRRWPAALIRTQNFDGERSLVGARGPRLLLRNGGVSSCSFGIVPSTGGPGFTPSSQAASVPHSIGVGIGVEGVIGVSRICSIFGGVDLDGQVEAHARPGVHGLTALAPGIERPAHRGTVCDCGRERRDRIARAPHG